MNEVGLFDEEILEDRVYDESREELLLLVFNNLDETYESLTVGVYDVFRLVENAELIILVVGNVSFIIFFIFNYIFILFF